MRRKRNDKIFETILEEISEESKQSFQLVNEVSEFALGNIADVISSSEPITVKLPYFGKFATSKKWSNLVKIKKLEKKNLVDVGYINLNNSNDGTQKEERISKGE